MLKELILAITLGALLGFGLTGGYLAVRNGRSSKIDTTIVSPTPNPTSANSRTEPTPTEVIEDTGDNQITLDEPENNAIVAVSDLTVKGSTAADSIVIITTADDSYLTKSDSSGRFSMDVKLESGANILEIDSVDSQDNQASTQITITYSTAKI